MKFRILLTAMALAILTDACQAQVRLVVPSSGRMVRGTFDVEYAPTQVAPTTVAAQTPQAAPTDGNDPKQRQLQKIQQILFDRRPSTILRVWLEPAPEPPKAPEPAATPNAAQPDAIPEANQPQQQQTATPPVDIHTLLRKAMGAQVTTPSPAATRAPAATPAPAANPQSATAVPPAAAPSAAQSPTQPAADAEKAAADAAAQQAAAQQAAAKAAEEQARADAQFDYELKLFQRNVTLGQWDEVQKYLAGLDPDVSRALYARLLEVLRSGAAGQPHVDPGLLQRMVLDSADPATLQSVLSAAGQGPGAAFAERNLMSMTDLRGLILAAPHELDDETFRRLGTILRQSIAAGHDLDTFLTDALEPKEGKATFQSRREVAQLLSVAGQPLRSGEYLPTLEEAESDAEALNLLARYFLALHDKEHKAEQLEKAWQATQALLALPIPEAPKGTSTSNAAANVDALEEPAETPEENPFGGANTAGATFDLAGTVISQPGQPATGTPVAAPEQAPADQAAAEAKSAQAKATEEAAKKIARLKQAKDEALRRAVELAPRVREELGQKWLDESFTSAVERGREILATIGMLVSGNLMSRPTDADFRLKSLQLERSAVEALLRAAPQTADEWKDTLTVLAVAWLRESQVSYELDNRERMGPGWRRDRYGNYFFVEEETEPSTMRYSNNMARPIKIDQLIETRPTDEWLALVRTDLHPKFSMMLAQLYLKMGEETKAFPFIEQLAPTHPEQAKTLAEQFLRLWTSNHNPNEGREGNDPFMYYYGYQQRADRIPLTRSKQQRNLQELTELVKKLRSLPIPELDERLYSRAFTTSHSAAEVYQLEAIENVFGSMDHLKPRTLAELVQQMRANLAGVWRAPDLQKKNSTNRKQRDIQLEILRGYETARAVLKRGLEKYPDHWALLLAEAAVLHDENDFQQELEKRSDFSARREDAMAHFRRAAESYVKAVPEMTEDEQSVLVFEQWFYASLGSVDLGRVTADKVPDLRQPALIRDTLASISGDAVEYHTSRFANDLFTRASSAKPELKFRYLKAGFEIVGDHKMAREARKLMDYYGDLVTEIKLEARIDGPDTVGHTRPFGIYVNLLHTKEIERESGGFGRYLQNQNNNQSYYYNFGRPLEDYRDKFEGFVSQSLNEHFEVISVTFQNPEVNSKALPEYGWRVTPYAYVLVKARGPQIDKLPPLRMDLDFLDTSGYVMLPVESAPIPLDARPEKGESRPVSDITITQTLDERQADEGRLVLEIRAVAHGLVPELEELVDLKPEGFEVEKIEDSGVSVTEFDKEAMDTTISSDRTWTVALKAAAKAEERPKQFTFAVAKAPTKDMVYQRYEDADLVSVTPVVSLEETYGKANLRWLWLASGGAVLLVVLALVAGRLARRARKPKPTPFAMPEQITPFTVLGLLREIHHKNGLSQPAKNELAASIDRLERHYFDRSEPTEPDLAKIAGHWLSQTGGATEHPHGGAKAS